jgi:DNA-binding PadR family transcriptional regulator
VAGTAKQTVRTTGTRGHDADFSRILPSTMKKLVEDGLFEPWEGSYRITDKGRRVLKQISE